MQDEILQIDCVGEEGERWRGHYIGLAYVKFVNGVDSEDTEEWEGSRINFRKPLNFRPVIVSEIEGPDLRSVGRE